MTFDHYTNRISSRNSNARAAIFPSPVVASIPVNDMGYAFLTGIEWFNFEIPI